MKTIFTEDEKLLIEQLRDLEFVEQPESHDDGYAYKWRKLAHKLVIELDASTQH